MSIFENFFFLGGRFFFKKKTKKRRLKCFLAKQKKQNIFQKIIFQYHIFSFFFFEKFQKNDDFLQKSLKIGEY